MSFADPRSLPHTANVQFDQHARSRSVDVDLSGAHLMSKAVGAPMVQQHCGCIVNIASSVGLGGFLRRNACTAAEVGVVTRTRSLACQSGAPGLRSNRIATGSIGTPLLQARVEARKVGVEGIQRRTPTSRIRQRRQIRPAAAYSASEGLSFVTRTTLAVNGGWSAFSGAGEVATAQVARRTRRAART